MNKPKASELIGEIGDAYFLLCDEDVDEVMRGMNFPKELSIIDCEDSVTIKIITDFGAEGTMKAARALLKLLNQEYHDAS